MQAPNVAVVVLSVVYENGRAYPEYLVRYYKGPRDPERTPYESLKDAVNGEKIRLKVLLLPNPRKTRTALVRCKAYGSLRTTTVNGSTTKGLTRSK
jgi:hypothetical protein